jgi:NO-binding membrane sensor protein with MHYT domain
MSMNKALLGLILGGILGAFDGLSAWFYPEVRNQLLGIVVGSTVKGLIAGILIGFFALKVKSLTLGVVFGLGIGLLLAYGVAAMQPPGQHYYFAIMLPGGIVGTITGYATQRFGRPTTRLRSSKV